jgi:hypothetical protein
MRTRELTIMREAGPGQELDVLFELDDLMSRYAEAVCDAEDAQRKADELRGKTIRMRLDFDMLLLRLTPEQRRIWNKATGEGDPRE